MRTLIIAGLLAIAGVSAGLAALGRIRRRRQKKTLRGRFKAERERAENAEKKPNAEDEIDILKGELDHTISSHRNDMDKWKKATEIWVRTAHIYKRMWKRQRRKLDACQKLLKELWEKDVIPWPIVDRAVQLIPEAKAKSDAARSQLPKKE